MSAAVQMRVSPAAVRRITDGLVRTRARTERSLETAFRNWGADWHRAVTDRFGKSATLRVRSGLLRQSIGARVTGSGAGDLRLRMTSAGAKYAKQREFGGVIKARSGGYLAIPTEANTQAANAQGSAREGSARAFIAAHPGETWFFRPQDGGRDLLLLMWNKPGAKEARSAQRFGLGGRAVRGQKGVRTAVAMFRLVREVDQPGPRSVKHKGPSKLGFFDEWRSRQRDRRADLARIARNVTRAGGGGA